MAVSAAIGASRPRRSTMFAVCLLFGAFQFGMALGGMVGGTVLESLVSTPLRLGAPVLIAAIGVLMITKGLRCQQATLKLATAVALVGASVSVSLDALGAGIALGLASGTSIAAAAAIGAVSVGMSAAGFACGRLFAKCTGFAEDLAGGFLIILAVVMFVRSI